MPVLRSRTVLPKTLESASSPALQPSTPIKSDEHPDPLILLSPMSSNLSTSPCSEPSAPLGLGFSASSQPALRRSSRLASKSNGHDPLIASNDKTDGSDRCSGRPEMKSKREKRNSRVPVSPAKKVRVLDFPDSGSGNVKAKKFESKGECIDMVSVSASDKDAALDFKENEATKDRISGDASSREKKEMGLGEEASGSRIGSGSFRRRSERLAGKDKIETGVAFMLDLNSVPEDGMEMESAEKTEFGFLGVRTKEDAEKEGAEEYKIGKKRKLGSSSVTRGAVVGTTSPLNSFTEDGEDKELLSLCLGSTISRGRIELANVDLNGVEEDKGGVELVGKSVEDFFAAEADCGAAAHGEKRYSKEEIANALLFEEDWLSMSTDAIISSAKGDQNNGVCRTNNKKRYTEAEKGKGKLIESNWLTISGNEEKLGANDVESNEEKLLQASFDSIGVKKIDDSKFSNELVKHIEWEKKDIIRRNKERFKALAKQFASKYAHFVPSEEDDPVPEPEIPIAEAGPEDEDWPGPFSTAMRIIEERAARLSARLGSSGSNQSKAGPMIKWVPSRNHDFKRLRLSVPSLHDICFSVLCKNAEAIASLDGVPDALRSKLSRLLCDSRKMSHQILHLIVSGSPSEICIKDCSCITEEQFQEIFQGCNTEQLMILQLDLCGRGMADYILRGTLARSPNSLSALTTISLRGAYRLSDDGLNALVSSAPSLKSINLGECSLLTSSGINILAENLGSVLMELYLDNCQNVDALLILPALKKLKHLEILSVTGIRNVIDKFVCGLLRVRGPNMKKLVFSGCWKLTDTSMKAVAQNCSGLHSLDIANLKKLTDSALQHLANGCRSLQVLRLCCNAFSDEGIAAFLEVSGGCLIELSLKNIKEVANNTAIALAARCSKTLSSLDLSMCRNMMDEALGLIVDKCLSLRLLKLFGCSQVTDKFLDGHSNPLVKIIGVKLTPITEHLHMEDTM